MMKRKREFFRNFVINIGKESELFMKKIFIILFFILTTSVMFAEKIDEDTLKTFMQEGTYIVYHSFSYMDKIYYINKTSILCIKTTSNNKLYISSNGGTFDDNDDYLYIDMSDYDFSLDEKNNLIIRRK